MWNEPTPSQLAQIPGPYETEKTSLQDKLIYLYFFVASCNWFIAEYDTGDLFWGFVFLGWDYFNTDWGYIPSCELKEVKVQGFFEEELETHWRNRPAKEIPKIVSCHSHWQVNQNDTCLQSRERRCGI